MKQTSSFRVPNSIACVVLSYNKPEITKRCLLSCLQLFKPESLFLIHNGSIPKHELALRNEFPNIHHHSLKQNVGYAGGAQSGIQSVFLNHGFQQCFFITNDCELLQFPSLELNSIPLLMFAGGCLLRKDQSLECTFGAVHLTHGRLRHLKNEQSLAPHERKYIPGHFFLISRNAWLQLGGFDTNLHTYWEDVDLSLRATANQIPLLHFADLRVQHAGGKTTRGNPFYSLFLFQRNRQRVVTRHSHQQFLFSMYFYFDLLRLFLKHLKQNKTENIRVFWRILSDRNT